eukprot:TRINITY_DN13678_c1_g2_i4.p1 TRINITY_DN13678_c1_g2~~TRINITY_DN13678_c1_g2_i4.p1  ORF type:complete len:367 (-),score=46.93 TRINITY_DN13678_c1_g2_i4:347-1447(-)
MINSVPQARTLMIDYSFQECIGGGSMGKVYRAIDMSGQATLGGTSRVVVVKVYSDDQKEITFSNEVELMKRVNGHLNVVEILTYSVGGKGIIMPYYGDYDFHQYVWQCDGILEFQSAGVTRDLLSALQHVHGRGIIHRDVKPENMILGHDGRAVLLDFDLACYASDTLATRTKSGSLGFMAPEVIRGEPCSFLSDVFSVGCVVYFMIAKVTPFLKKKGMTTDEVEEANEECKVSFGRRFNNVSRDYLDFVLSIIVSDPERRLSEQHASEHAWLACEETARCRTPSLETTVPRMKVADGAASESGMGPVSRRSRLAKAKIVCRSIACSMSRAFGNARRKTSMVSPSGSKDEDPAEDFTSLTGVLIRD